MRRFPRVVFLALIVPLTMPIAKAQDSVNVRYLYGYPVPARSSERVAVRVERVGTSINPDDQAVDRYFSLVLAALSEYGIAGDWQVVIPDAPSIEITVELNGRRIRLASAHLPLESTGKHVVTERGAEALNERNRDAVLLQQSEKYRRHRLGFERLLALTLERVRGRLSP